jgi:hypothetical protein
MSDVGLQSGTYQRVRDLAELVDRALVALRVARHSGASRASDGVQETLSRFLIALSDEANSDLSARMLFHLLEDVPGMAPARLREIGEAIRLGLPTDSVLSWLEQLARALEFEQVQATARMKAGAQ